MHWFIVSILFQVLCVVHLMKSGNNKLWLSAIIFLPLAGSAAYFVMEILPDLLGNKHARYAKKKAIEKIDPDKDIRLARERLAITDSLANRTDLADALAAKGDYQSASSEYHSIIQSPQGQDAKTVYKYANALFQTGRFSEALDAIEQNEGEDGADSDRNRQSLLKARILENLGRDDEASEMFENVVEKLPGIEPRCHYAALLLKMDRGAEARSQLQEVMKASKLMDHIQIGDDRPILEWAKFELKKLEEA